MSEQLSTTNILLGVMAAVSLLEALLLVGVGVAAFLVYRRLFSFIAVLDGIEDRQIAPLVAHIHGVLGDVQSVTTRVRVDAERVDRAITNTIERVDASAGRVRDTVRRQTRPLVGFMRGARVALQSFVDGQPRRDRGPNRNI